MGNQQAKIAELDGEVNLNHFRLLRVVGRGSFGKVRIVERKDTGMTFALKYIRKDEIIRSESVRNVLRERRMLEHINHPFICNLRYSFQDMEYMYLIVDLMTGGDLRFHISRKSFTEEAVRFWIAELGCALRYIHRQGIIHRDVKPDNVLLDAEGHVHLTDFNVASDIVPGRLLTSKSGTLSYLAPEIYAGKGYDTRADWWSLGVLLFECVYNKRPFEGNCERTLSAQILTAKPRYPITQPSVSAHCLHAMQAALEPDRDKRMGSTWNSFIHHEFFRSLDFDALELKLIEPVFIPSADKTNFDATWDLEELLLEEAPLEARARRQKPREPLKDDATNQEIREHELHHTIEKEFRSFDYTVTAFQKLVAQAEQSMAQVNNGELVASSISSSPGPTPPVVAATREGEPAGTPTPPFNWAELSVEGSARQPPSLNAENGAYSYSTSSSHQALVEQTPPQLKPNLQNPINLKAGQQPATPICGIHVPSDSASSWSNLTPEITSVKSEGSGSVFSFLSRKKGHSTVSRPRERGVLGKEGSRVVIG